MAPPIMKRRGAAGRARPDAPDGKVMFRWSMALSGGFDPPLGEAPLHTMTMQTAV